MHIRTHSYRQTHTDTHRHTHKHTHKHTHTHTHTLEWWWNSIIWERFQKDAAALKNESISDQESNPCESEVKLSAKFLLSTLSFIFWVVLLCNFGYLLYDVGYGLCQLQHTTLLSDIRSFGFDFISFLFFSLFLSLTLSFFPSFFLDAFSHLYKRVCPSVGPSVRRSVGRSVTHELKSCLSAVFDQNWDT